MDSTGLDMKKTKLDQEAVKKVKPGCTSLLEKIAYGFGDVGANFAWTYAGSFITLYYTDCVFKSNAAAIMAIGTMMLIARLLDGLSDIVMGIIIEHTSTKWGKARPWFGISIIPMGIACLLMFNVPNIGQTGQMIYCWVTYIFMTVVVYTINNLSYHAQLSRFSLNVNDQNSISAIRQVMVEITCLAIAAMVMPLLNFFAPTGVTGSESQRAWLFVTAVMALLCIIFQGISFSVVKEKIPCKSTKAVSKEEKLQGKAAKRGSLKTVLKTRYFYIAILMFFSLFAIHALYLASAVYYARDVLGNKNLYAVISLFYTLATILVLLFTSGIVRRVGKRRLMILCNIIAIVSGILLLLSPTSMPLTMASVFIKAVGLAPLTAMVFTMAPDIVRYIELKNNQRVEGYATAANSVGMKVGTGVGSALITWILAYCGYDASLMQQTKSVLNGEIALFAGIPIVLSVICLILSLFWDIDKRIAAEEGKKE